MVDPVIPSASDRATTPTVAPARRSWLLRTLGTFVLVYALVILALMWWWDTEPAHFDVAQAAREHAGGTAKALPIGYATVVSAVSATQTMLDKRGGYLSNDRFPPGVLMDNQPNWEFGALTAIRDLTRSLRNDFSRSQTQSVEDKDLQEAEPLFSSPNDRWLLPSSESQYRKGVERLDGYLARLADSDPNNAQFYARADNLGDYLQIVSQRLGSLSQRLSASIGQVRIDTDLANDASAQQSKPTASARMVQTAWNKIDDNFYEARGYTWALREQLEAIRIDFSQVLRDKNALVSLEQVMRELEEAQKPLRSPMVLNGSPYGFFGNHSLVLANYVSRANAAVIELQSLLRRG